MLKLNVIRLHSDKLIELKGTFQKDHNIKIEKMEVVIHLASIYMKKADIYTSNQKSLHIWNNIVNLIFQSCYISIDDLNNYNNIPTNKGNDLLSKISTVCNDSWNNCHALKTDIGVSVLKQLSNTMANILELLIDGQSLDTEQFDITTWISQATNVLNILDDQVLLKYELLDTMIFSDINTVIKLWQNINKKTNTVIIIHSIINRLYETFDIELFIHESNGDDTWQLNWILLSHYLAFNYFIRCTNEDNALAYGEHIQHEIVSAVKEKNIKHSIKQGVTIYIGNISYRTINRRILPTYSFFLH